MRSGFENIADPESDFRDEIDLFGEVQPEIEVRVPATRKLTPEQLSKHRRRRLHPLVRAQLSLELAFTNKTAKLLAKEFGVSPQSVSQLKKRIQSARPLLRFYRKDGRLFFE